MIVRNNHVVFRPNNIEDQDPGDHDDGIAKAAKRALDHKTHGRSGASTCACAGTKTMNKCAIAGCGVCAVGWVRAERAAMRVLNTRIR